MVLRVGVSRYAVVAMNRKKEPDLTPKVGAVRLTMAIMVIELFPMETLENAKKFTLQAPLSVNVLMKLGKSTRMPKYHRISC